MPNHHIDSDQSNQSKQIKKKMLLDFLTTKALDIVTEALKAGQKKAFTFDPQGNVLLHLQLNEEDYKKLKRKFNGEELLLNKQKEQLSQELGRGNDFFNRDFLINLGVMTTSGVTLKDSLNLISVRERFYKWLIDKASEENNIKETFKLLQKETSQQTLTSVNSLQQEAIGFISQRINSLKNVAFKDQKIAAEISKEAWLEIQQETESIINKQVIRKKFQEALLLSSSEKTNVNKTLDAARATLSLAGNEALMTALEHYFERKRKEADLNKQPLQPLITAQQELITSLEVNLDKNRFKGTVGSTEHFVKIDFGNWSRTIIEGTDYAAHDKKLGKEKQALRLIFSDSTTDDDHYVFGRVPSLAVLKTGKQKLSSEKVIEDIQLKLDYDYQQLSEANGGYQGPIAYNLLTSLHSKVGEIFLDHKNRQRTSAELLLKASHNFNEKALTGGTENFFFIQNIPVNQHGKHLSYSTGIFANATVREATLMSEIALLFTLTQNSTHLPEFLECYDLELRSALPENNALIAERGKIYLSQDSTGPYKYVVHNFKGEIFEGTINTKGIDLKNLGAKIKDPTFRKEILEAISKAGHIQKIDHTYKEIKSHYTKFLNQPNRPAFFCHSQEGKNAIKKLQQFKKTVWDQASDKALDTGLTPDNATKIPLRSLLSRALLKMLFMKSSGNDGAHMALQYGCMIQSISLFIGPPALVGCKSGNERTKMVCGRYLMLQSIQNRDLEQLLSLEKDFIRTLRGFVRGQKTCVDLQLSLDKAYDAHHLENEATQISHADQGGSAKVKADSSSKNGKINKVNTNVAEQKMLNLYAKKATTTQVHKRAGNGKTQFENFKESLKRLAKKLGEQKEKIEEQEKKKTEKINSNSDSNNLIKRQGKNKNLTTKINPHNKIPKNKMGNPKNKMGKRISSNTLLSNNPHSLLNQKENTNSSLVDNPLIKENSLKL